MTCDSGSMLINLITEDKLIYLQLSNNLSFDKCKARGDVLNMWIGLDVGTTAVKAAAYTEDAKLVALCEKPTSVIRAKPTYAEQDMNATWDTVVQVLKDLTNQIDATQVKSLGVAAQGDGLWAMDAEGIPVGPAMLWNDTRSARDVLALTEFGKNAIIARGCHTANWPGTSGSLWRWLIANNSEAIAKVNTVFNCADWISYKLTGEIATDYANASIPFLDFSDRVYGTDQIEALDCESLKDKLQPPQRASEKLGEISQSVADKTGLPAGLSVSTGTLDLGAMIVGMGLDKPGQAMMIIGTTAVVNILTDKIDSSDEPIGASVLHSTSDAIIRVLAPSTGASAFDWFAKLHPASLGGESTTEISNKINLLVKKVTPGSNGVIFLPYLNGERAPFVEPEIQASFNGLTISTTKADMGRAVMEGTGFSLRHCIEEEGGLPNGAIQLTGGASKNNVWCQIIADIINHPIEVSENSDQGLWGAACIGAAAAGFGAAIELSKRNEVLTTYEPNRANAKTYDQLFQQYKIFSNASRHTYAALRDIGVE